MFHRNAQTCHAYCTYCFRFNQFVGKDKLINSQVKDYVYGLYGRPPAPVDSKYTSIALKDYPQGDKPISSRPADLLPPELDQAAEEIKDLSSDVKDILICFK